MNSFLRNRLLVLFILISKNSKSTFLKSIFWIKDLNFLKVTSIVVANCILLSFVYGQAVAQVVENTISTQQFKKVVSEFILPHSYGKITDANFCGSDTVIVNIQDLHLHPDVQKNIANTIKLFDNKYGIKNVYMEGSQGQVDTSWLTNIKDKKTITDLLDTGMLTGAEYYSAISNRPELIKGLENKEPYLQNLKRFGNILNSQNEISTILASIEKDIKYLKVYISTKNKGNLKTYQMNMQQERLRQRNIMH